MRDFETRPQGRILRNALAFLSVTLLLAGCVAPSPQAEAPAGVASAPAPALAGMDPARTIADNLGRSADHRTLSAAIRGAGLGETLAGQGPFTLFAPTDEAFQRLPAGTMESLMAPANRSLLGQLVNYHVVPGAKTRAQIAADASAGGGVATYRTVQGSFIRVSMRGDAVTVADVHNNRSSVRTADAAQSNGVVHVLDGVLLPNF